MVAGEVIQSENLESRRAHLEGPLENICSESPGTEGETGRVPGSACF